jgi:hypothetical protein
MGTGSTNTRIGKILVGGSVVVLLQGQLAFAAPGTVQEASVFNLPAGVACSFPLRIEVSEAMVRMVTFEARNTKPARTITVRTGAVLKYTNTATGERMSVKTVGYGANSVTADGVETVTANGSLGLVSFADDGSAGPTTTQYTGRIVYKINLATGAFTLVTTSNPGTNVCAELS